MCPPPKRCGISGRHEGVSTAKPHGQRTLDLGVNTLGQRGEITQVLSRLSLSVFGPGSATGFADRDGPSSLDGLRRWVCRAVLGHHPHPRADPSLAVRGAGRRPGTAPGSRTIRPGISAKG